MNKFNNITEFKIAMSNFEKTSYDSSNRVSLIMSDIEAVNFDMVKNNYVSSLNKKPSKMPDSVDALYLGEDNRVIFIEFKNGNISKELYNLRRKIYDSILIFTDIANCGICFLRDNAEYILVYNGTLENINATNPKKNTEKTKIQQSPDYQNLAKAITKASGGEKTKIPIKYGLSEFKNFCFLEVNTYTKEEFYDFIKVLDVEQFKN